MLILHVISINNVGKLHTLAKKKTQVKAKWALNTMRGEWDELGWVGAGVCMEDWVGGVCGTADVRVGGCMSG